MSFTYNGDILGPGQQNELGEETTIRCTVCGDSNKEDPNRNMRVYQGGTGTTTLSCPNCHAVQHVPDSVVSAHKKK